MVGWGEGGGLLSRFSKLNVLKFQMLSKSVQWLLRKSILCYGTLSWIMVVVVVVVLNRNTVVALASAGFSVGLASWGQTI